MKKKRGEELPTIQVVPGAGGEESQDFARLLCEMYLARARRHGMTVSVAAQKDQPPTLYFQSGEEFYDIGRNERGIHRLVRVSPFDPQKRRHTSFASVYVNGQTDERVQRRSYIFEPYQQVSDYIGEWVRHDVVAFLAGDVEGPMSDGD